jgi:predicted nucleic acid-binding protein
MDRYFDTSYLFRVYSREPGCAQVQALLPGCQTICSAAHARAEFAAVILRKRRENADTAMNLGELHGQFLDELRAGHVRMLPLTEPVFERVESVMRAAPPATFLRAADAMHLACAVIHGFEAVYSNDRHLLAAAPLFGLRGVNVIS